VSTGDEDDTEKPHEATPRKLEEARKRGEVPRTADLTAAAGAAGLLSLALLPGGWVPLRLGDLGLALLDRADAVGASILAPGSALVDAMMRTLMLTLAPLALLPILAIVVLLIALRALVFAPQKLAPKLSRISPIANAKQKFGPSGLMEFAKSTVKLILFSAVLWAFLAARLPRMMATLGHAPGPITAELMRLLAEFLAFVVLIMVVVGGLDHLWQVHDHRRQQRMSHKELRDEHKEAEGDPHLKQQRRHRATEIATNQMLGDVPKAAVVIVNPTHFAVALKWKPGDRGAPICVAKGVDDVAARIREAACDAGVPIHSDPPTARALHATVKLGAEISADHYAPVAAAIRFAEEMRQKARNGR